MVISDRSNSDHVVEIFDVVGETFEALTLKHLHTVVDADHLISPNDLVALDGERFYAANDHGARSKLLRGVEDLAGLPLSTVSFWDGSRGHHRRVGDLVRQRHGPRPCTRPPVRAATRSKKISVYPLDAQAPAKWLFEGDSIPLPGCPDNLEWDEEGNLWIGADPSFEQLALYVDGLAQAGASQVLCVSFDQQHEPESKNCGETKPATRSRHRASPPSMEKGGCGGSSSVQPFGNFLRDCELVQ